MRLPSQTPNACDLIRLMSLQVDEPDLKVVSGEEYLRPMEVEEGGRASYLIPLSSVRIQPQRNLHCRITSLYYYYSTTTTANTTTANNNNTNACIYK